MFIIRDYLTREIVAVVTRKEDAVAISTAPRNTHDPVLVYEESR
jgi:hypothetical protein